MKKFTFIALVMLAFGWHSQAQIVTDASAWPNAAWTLSGTYDAGSLGGDPTVADGNLSYDDDNAGSGSTDIIFLESPVIDLTAAQVGGETLVTIDLDYDYNLGGDFDLEYWDFGTLTWVTWTAIADNSGTTSNWCGSVVATTLADLDISGFTGAQLSNFKYRYNYNASAVFGWGFCMTSSVLSSSSPATCFDVTGLTLDSVTTTTANISWTAAAGETDWEIAVQAAGTGEPGAADGSGTDTTTNNPHIEAGLTAATAYEVYVRAECTAGTDFGGWVGPLNFTTDCLVETAPYTEDFENAGAVPTCWTLAGDENWLFSNSGAGNHIGNNGTITGATASGGYFAWLDDSTPDATNAELATPMVDVSGLTTPALSFYELSDNEGFVNATLTVDVWDGAAWNTVGTYNTNTTGWEEKFIDLSGLTFTGPAQARFLIADSGQFYDDIAIDDVTFDEYPACFVPTTLAIDSSNAASASISWSAGVSGETAWEIVVQADGLGEPAGAGTATTTNSPHFALGLTSSTDYEVYVRANCGGGDFSGWIGPVDFTTDPDVVPTCPATFTATPDVSCGNFDTTISWDASAIADGYRLTVGTTTGASDVVNNADLGDVLTTDVPLQTPSQTYFYTVTPYNIVGDGVCTEQTYTTVVDACLCASVPTSVDNDGLANVRVGLDDFAVTAGVTYTDHSFANSGIVNQLSQGVPINIDIDFVTGFTYDTHIWIDLNDNGSLDDAGELVYSGVSLATNPTTLDADFTVPAAAALGQHKMRISAADTGQGTANSCYNGSFGVTVDFDVNITAPACTPAVIASSTVVTDCTAGTFTVDVEVTSVGTATFIVGLAPTPIVAGTNTVGPFTLGTTSPNLQVVDVTNGACNINIGTFDGDTSPPTALGVSNITETTADLDWTSNGSETTWEVLILAGGDPAPANTTPGTDTLTANPYTVTTLTGQTSYDAYVRASCGTNPDWVGPVNFATACADIVPAYTADMTTNVPDLCWDEAADGEVAAGPTGLGTSLWDDNRNYGGTVSNSINLYQGNTRREWLLSPTFDLSGGSYQLEVEVALTDFASGTNPGAMGSDDTVLLLQSIDGGTTWTTLETWHAGNEPDVAGTEFIADLSAIVGSAQFAIWASDGAVDDAEDFDFHIGKFVVRTPPTCLDVSGITLDSFTDTTAQISWTDGSGETDWEIAVQAAGTGEPGAADGSGTNTTTNPHTASGLTSATAYEVYVRADCDADGLNHSAWGGPLNFLTLPSAPNGVTCTVGSSSQIFTEEFDSQGTWTGNFSSADGNWELPDASGSGGTGADNAFSGGNYMNFEAGTSSATASAVSPAIDLVPAVDGAELAFYMHAYGASMGTLNVGVSTTGAGGPFTTEFTWSGQLQTSGADAWTPVGVDLSAYMGSTIHIEFSHTGTGAFEGDMSIDLMTVEACGAYCVDPTVVVASNITGTTADIAWTENGSATDWEIVVQAAGTGVPGAADGSGTDITMNPYSATGLLELTTYEVYVRSECTAGTTFSGWTGPYNFSTTVLCPDVTGITVDSFTDTTAEISWTAGGGTLEAGWEIVVQADGTGAPAGAGTATTSVHSESGLTAETAYEVYVRANCAGDGFSGWAGPVDFTTACAAITPDYTADMSTNAPDSGVCWLEADSGDATSGPSDIGSSTWIASNHNGTPSNRINLWQAVRSDWIISPTFDLSAALAYELNVYVALTNNGTNGTGEQMGSDDSVSLIQSNDGGATWTTLQTWTQGTEPSETGIAITYDLTAETGNVQFAFLGDEGSVDDTNDVYFHVSGFQVRETPSCPDVSAITTSSITATSASIGWTNGGGDTLWEVAVQAAGTGEPGAAQDTGTDTASNPYSAGSLTAETAYEVYVRADCGATLGGWIGPVNFTTPCAALTPDYTADMSTNAPDSNVCWNQAADGEVATGPIGLGASLWTTGSYAVGSNRLNMYQATAREWLLSPGFDLSTGGPYQLEVDVAVTNWNSSTVADTMGSDDEVQLLQSNDNGATWINITTWNAASALPPTGTEYVADLTGETGTNVLFAIMASEGTVNDIEDYDFHVGKFVVRAIPSCPDVSVITATNITTTSADIGWTNGGSETAWEVAVQTVGTGEPAAADGSGADSATNPYNATGLSSSTTYEVYVRAECTAGVEFGAWVGPFNFATDCDTFTTFPYSEGFETGVPPTCWTSFRGTNGEGDNDWTTNGTANSGSAAAYVAWQNTGFVQEDWLVSPEFDMTTLTNPELSFYYRDAFGAAYGSSLTIRVSTTDTAHASFTTVDTYAEPDSTTYQQAIVDLSAYASAPSVYVAFVWTNDDGDSLYLDDVFIWDNAPGTYTYTNGVWSPFAPANDLDDIIVAAGDLVVDSDLNCNTMTVNPGASVTVDSGVTLTATSGLTLESSSTSYSSLIRDGSIVGNIDYLRHINQNGSGTTGSNDLVSAPLTGQAFNMFATANPNILNNGTLFLFGPFNKGTGSYVNWAATETATLDPGVGYRSGTTDNGTVIFTGTDNNGTITNDIQNSGPNNAEWNLVGNPYPAYLNVQNFLVASAGPGLVNIQLFDPPTAAIYGYDGSALNGWTLYNLANTTASTAMAPGQGFMVSANAANVAGGDLTFTPSMRRTGNGDDFIVGRNAELVYLKLNLSTNSKVYTTDFYFNANATKGFDVGYDANIWGDTTPDFAVYSHLVEDNNGDAVALQALSSTDLNDVTIPLGVIANQGEQLTFSIGDISLPESVNVYLEDVVANTSTLLNDSDYIVTPTTALSGTGRFFLRTSQDALSELDNSLDNLDIFTLKASSELVVSGELLDDTMLTLFDIQGRLVLSTKLDHTLLQNRIDVSSINSGVYIVTLQNNGEEKTKKVIID